MAKISTVAALATVAVVVAGAGVGAYYLAKRRCACRIRNPTKWRFASVIPEPPEGYEPRWESVRDMALERCRHNPEVMTFPQAVQCALATAYPEGMPWRDPETWTSWMADAVTLVQADIAQAASRDGGDPRGWEVALWLSGGSLVEAYRQHGYAPASAARLAAQALYPAKDWTHPDPWQTELVAALEEGP